MEQVSSDKQITILIKSKVNNILYLLEHKCSGTYFLRLICKEIPLGLASV